MQENHHLKTAASADTKRSASCRMNAVSILIRMFSYKVHERDGEKMPVISLNPRAALSGSLECGKKQSGRGGALKIFLGILMGRILDNNILAFTAKRRTY